MRKQQLMKRVAATAVAAGIFAPFAALAQTQTGPLDPQSDLGFNTIRDNLGLSTQENIKLVISRIVRVLLGFLGIIAVIIVLYGGFQWMTAAGNEERVSSARATLTAGLIGLVIILSAYALAAFIISTILNTTA